MDDVIIIIGNDKAKLQSLNSSLFNELNVKYVGLLKYFFRIELAHSSAGTIVSWWKCTVNLEIEKGYVVSQLNGTPMDANQKLAMEGGGELIQ